jgi:hypothetical protein
VNKLKEVIAELRKCDQTRLDMATALAALRVHLANIDQLIAGLQTQPILPPEEPRT